MKSEKIRKMIFAALFAALTCTVTAALPIRSPLGGYFNLGDAVILLGALLLGPYWGAAAGGIGAAMADLLLGYGIYAPATLVIKALVALTAGLIFLRTTKHKYPILALAAVAGEAVMAAGYFLFEAAMYGVATASGNLLVTNLPQAAISIATAAALYFLLEKAKLTRRIQHV